VALAREAHHIAYPVPMIFAASMGPMPKISVRVVSETSTSASMRSRLGSRSFDPVSGRFAQDLRSQPPRRRAETPPLGCIPHARCAARWVESVSGYPSGDEVL